MIVMKHIKQVISVWQGKILIQKMYGHSLTRLKISWVTLDNGVDVANVDPSDPVLVQIQVHWSGLS